MGSRLGTLAIALVGLIALLLASCATTPSAPATSGTSAPTSFPAATATPDTRPQGSIKIAGNFQTGSSLNPISGSDGWFANLSRYAIFDPIQQPDANGNYGPGIAERWEIAPDLMSQTLYIRKGVKFSNGDNLTGADVKFTIEKLMSPESTFFFKATWIAQIAGVDLKDDYTVVIRLKTPQALLLGNLGFHQAVVLPMKYYQAQGADNFAKNPVGSGAWKVVSYQAGTSLVLEAVDNHWRAKPQFKTITIMHVPEEATKVSMLKTGELDLAEVSPDSAAGLKSTGLGISSYPAGGQVAALIFNDPENPTKYPVGDLRVRKAMQLAINSQEFIDNIYRGYGEKVALIGVSPKATFFDPSLKPDPFDPEGAKKLMADAGFASGFSLKMWDHGGFHSTLTSAIGGYWKKIGIAAENTPLDTGAYIQLYTPKLQPQIFNTVRIGPGMPANLVFDMMNTLYHSKQGLYKNTMNPELDKLIEQYGATANEAARQQIGRQATVMAQQEYTDSRIMAINRIVAFNSKLVGQVPGYAHFTGIPGNQLEAITRAK